MIKKLNLIILLMFISGSILSQINFVFDKKKADSLDLVLDSVSGKNRVNVLNQLSFLYNRWEPKTSNILAIEAFDLSKELQYPQGNAFAYYNLGILDYLDGKFSDAAEKLYNALNYFEDLQDTAMMIDTYIQLASTLYFSETEKDSGPKLLQEGLKLALASKNNLRAAQIYASFGYIANTYSSLDGSVGKQMFEKYYHYIEGIPVSRIEKALMIASYGDSYKLSGNTRIAIDKYLLSFRIYNPDAIEERALMSQCSSTLGAMYEEIGKPDSALYYFKYGIGLSRKYNHLYGFYRCYLYLAEYFIKKEFYKQSATCCDSAIYYASLSSSLGSFYLNPEYSRVPGVSIEIYVPISRGYKKFLAWSFMQQAYQLLQDIYEETGDISKAYTTLIASSQVRDSINLYNKNKELKDIEAKYETVKKEEEIASLSNANKLQLLKIRQNSFFLAGMGGLLILIILLAVILLRQNKLKADHQAILLKQRLFRSQMNPHFIFNSLGSIQSSIINEEPDKAVRYLSRFSKLMRSILDSTTEELIPLQEEINTIENYLALQKVRYADKFDYKIDIDTDIDTETVMLPPMLAQPFIENAIEHGIKHKDGKGRIAVRIYRLGDLTIGRLGDWAVFEVEDDGVGREKALEMLQKQDKDHKSLATVITRERIAALNRKSNKKITLEIIDLADDEGNARGTLVRFGIPL